MFSSSDTYILTSSTPNVADLHQIRRRLKINHPVNAPWSRRRFDCDWLCGTVSSACPLAAGHDDDNGRIDEIVHPVWMSVLLLDTYVGLVLRAGTFLYWICTWDGYRSQEMGSRRKEGRETFAWCSGYPI